MLQPMQHLFLFSRRALAQPLREGFEEVSVDTAYKTLRADYLINCDQATESAALGALGTDARGASFDASQVPAHQHR